MQKIERIKENGMREKMQQEKVVVKEFKKAHDKKNEAEESEHVKSSNQGDEEIGENIS